MKLNISYHIFSVFPYTQHLMPSYWDLDGQCILQSASLISLQ